MSARLVAIALAGALAVAASFILPAQSDQPFLRSPVMNSDGGRAFH